MSFVVFENPGVIDERAIKTFGLSAKETANPIGFFGTGLKYAVAILSREKQELELYAGKNKFLFRSSTIEMRGKSFDMIKMNGEELPFTTHLGTNWKLWQAFRELYCNCLDEGGTVYISETKPKPSKDKTLFVVDGEDFTNCYHMRDEIVLNLNEKYLVSNGRNRIYDIKSNSLFYRGVRVYDSPRPFMMTYNLFDETDLTEDRTLKYLSYAFAKAANSVATITDKGIIKKILTCGPEFIESEFNYSDIGWFGKPTTNEFDEVLSELFMTNNDKMNNSARELHRKKTNIAASKNYQEVEMTNVEAIQLDRAKRICLKAFPHFEDYPIMVVKDLGNQTMALADESTNKMVISRKCFEMGTKYLVSTLIEEYTHLKTGHRDETREMQTHLFDTICTIIENHVIKEPI